jgi:hypothetical protein
VSARRPQLRLALLVVAALWLATSGTASAAQVLWSADHEPGDLSQWTRDGLGGEYNTGTGDARVTTERARSGAYALALTITAADGTQGSQATRMFRWGYEGRPLPRTAYYSAWFYFPRVWTPSVYWNVMQWKTKESRATTSPAMTLNVGARSGAMFLYLYDHLRAVNAGGAAIGLPTGRWVHVEALYRFSPRPTGRVTVWQDGVRILHLDGLRTQRRSRERYARQWSIDNYTSSLWPSRATIYVDDAAVSRGRLGGGG